MGLSELDDIDEFTMDFSLNELRTIDLAVLVLLGKQGLSHECRHTAMQIKLKIRRNCMRLSMFADFANAEMCLAAKNRY